MSVWQRSGPDRIWQIGVEGRLAQDLNPQLEETLVGLLDQDQNRLVVDLSETSYINSGGLRTLLTAWRRARQQGGNLVLFGLNRHVQDVFEIVGFDKVFDIYESEEEALAAWKEEA
jgi:anti-sigma B factor antagonist